MFCKFLEIEAPFSFTCKEWLCVGWGGYYQLCCQASPKLLLRLGLGLGCDEIGFSASQGRSWENWLEKYIVVEVYLRAEKYNLSPQKSIFRPFLPETRGGWAVPSSVRRVQAF